MSRTLFSASRPRRGGTYRPLLEALEDRFAPGSLVGTLQPPSNDPTPSGVQRDREADQLAFLTGLPAGAGLGLQTPPAPDLPGPLPGAGGGAGGTARGASSAPTRTTSPVVEFVDRSIVRGESTLTRTDHGVTIHLRASDMPAGAYTFWWVVFNPGATGPIAGWGTGHVLGQGGNLNVATHLREGEMISGVPFLPGGTLHDARRGEIWMVVRYHGPVDPGRVYEQTHTYEPGQATDLLITMHRAP